MRCYTTRTTISLGCRFRDILHQTQSISWLQISWDIPAKSQYLMVADFMQNFRFDYFQSLPPCLGLLSSAELQSPCHWRWWWPPASPLWPQWPQPPFLPSDRSLMDIMMSVRRGQQVKRGRCGSSNMANMFQRKCLLQYLTGWDFMRYLKMKFTSLQKYICTYQY